MKIQKQEAKEKLIQRLRRIEGQVHGIEGMLEDERDCREVLQQLASIRSAVQGVSRVFLQEYATECLLELDQDDSVVHKAEIRTKRQEIVQNMIALLDKAP